MDTEDHASKNTDHAEARYKVYPTAASISEEIERGDGKTHDEVTAQELGGSHDEGTAKWSGGTKAKLISTLRLTISRGCCLIPDSPKSKIVQRFA